MSAKVTQMRVPGPKGHKGVFKCKHFNMFDEEDLAAYTQLRQKDNDPSSGLVIDVMREFIRKIRDEEYEGEMKTVHEEEIPHVYIEWWEKPPSRTKGDSHVEQKKAGAGWRD